MTKLRAPNRLFSPASSAEQAHPSQAAMRCAGVVGFPINHSLSPAIFHYWFAQCAVRATYDKIEVRGGELPALLPRLRAAGYVGLNVTVPLKVEALAAADCSSDEARMVGAANCLTWSEDNRIVADNTDVAGITSAITQQRGAANWRGSSAVVLGAGGAARAMMYVLSQLGMERVWIVNRSAAAAEKLAHDFAVGGIGNIETMGWSELRTSPALARAELVVNSTSLGMGTQPPLPVELLDFTRAPPHALVFDMVYQPLRTALLAAAQAAGLRTVNGLHMLVHQALPAFARWFKPDGTMPNANDTLRYLVKYCIK